MVLAPPDDDPSAWPDDMLITRRQLRTLLGEGVPRIVASADFPPPCGWAGAGGTAPQWTVGQARDWERTHCLYGTGYTRCTRPRITDIDKLGLCKQHHKQARAILRRKDFYQWPKETPQSPSSATW